MTSTHRPETVLAVEIGNTVTALGVFEGLELRGVFRIPSPVPRTGDELLPIVEHWVTPFREALLQSRRCVIGSVVPSLTPAYQDLVQKLFGRDARVIDAARTRGLTVDVAEPDSVGADRIANAAAVAELYGVPAIVVDLGTATNFDVVLSGPRYVGGAIAPGILTSAEDLFRRAARLSMVDIVRPDHAIGKNTAECLQSGIFFGAVEQVDGIVRWISHELGLRPRVVATGGLAEAIAAESGTIREVDQTLTLKGLAILEGRLESDDRSRGSRPRSRSAVGSRKRVRAQN